eukprot:PhF_6_TR7022/c0_g4_i1/m.10473
MFAKPQLTEKPLICKACKTPYDPVIDRVQPSHHKEHQTYVICTSSDLEPYHYVQKSLQSGPSPTWVCGCAYINPLRTTVCEVCEGIYTAFPDHDPRLTLGGRSRCCPSNEVSQWSH